MFGWIDRIAKAIYQRGRALTEADSKVTEERRSTIRDVREALTDAMTYAERDRDHGSDEDRDQAKGAANRAASLVREVLDEDAQRLVAHWKGLFDAIPKGWKEGTSEGFGYGPKPPGYPKAAWADLRAASDRAQDRLGRLLQELIAPPK